ncbi:MAG: 2-iminoacetate synthase ThiH [Lentisphaerae bacterium]|nr:2-iminoacetate synthase ThiH [Lentisphaerota bacterium]
MSTAPAALPAWLDPTPWLAVAATARPADVEAALACENPGARELAAMLSPAGEAYLEAMAQRARALTRRHFGDTITLYVPLYLSNFCSNGCAYCAFAADRRIPRRALTPAEIDHELDALASLGFEEVLLLTGERTPQADLDYLAEAVRRAARRFHQVAVEAFPMSTDEYRVLVDAGCTGVTVYQETYEPRLYDRLHRWGPKKDFLARLETPSRALRAGVHSVGLGALLGLHDPIHDALCLYLHARHLLREHWRAGVALSFPRLRPQAGDFTAPCPIDDAWLARLICACRICLPEVPLLLSTRESAAFRDGMAGLGISKMSIASRTTVGGYDRERDDGVGQFEVNDHRDIDTFCASLRARHLQPVFKSWDASYREHPQDLDTLTAHAG